MSSMLTDTDASSMTASACSIVGVNVLEGAPALTRFLELDLAPSADEGCASSSAPAAAGATGTGTEAAPGCIVSDFTGTPGSNQPAISM